MAVLLPYALPSLPKTQSDDWVRPSDWPVITDTPNEIWALVNDQGAATVAFTAAFTGTAFVDWGDGSGPVSITSGVTFKKSYTPGTGATCSRGYTTFKVRIYGATTFTSLRPNFTTSTADNTSYLGSMYSVGLLEMYYGDGVGVGNAGSYFASVANSAASMFQQLEYVKFPSSLSSFSMSSMFINCESLQKVILPDTIPASTNFANAFESCASLKSITMPSFGSISSLASTFSGCSSLKSVIFPSVSTSTLISSITTLASTFANCYKLVSIDLPAITAATTLTSTFINCSSLRYFRTYGSPSGVSPNSASMFQGCGSLEQAIFPNPASASTFSANSMFQVCSSLKNIVFPDKILFSSMAQMFQSCYAIQRVEFQATSMPGLTSVATMFSGCLNILSVILPTSGSGSINGGSMFISCPSIGTFSSTLAFNTTGSMFSGCQNLKSVSLPGMTASTACNSMFQNCSNLTDITFPGTLTACVTFADMFNGCSGLKSFTMPAITVAASSSSTNAFNGMFRDCASLRNVAFTSFGAHTYTGMSLFYQNMFTGCSSLQSVDMSPFSSLNINGNSTTDLSQGVMFNNCYSLKTLKYGFNVQSSTMPSGSPNIAASLLNCASLTNLDISAAYATQSNLLSWQAIGTATINIPQVQGMTFSCKFSRFQHYGTAAIRYNLQNLRLTNTTAGQYGGASPQIDVSYTLMGQAALVQLFNDLPTLTSKTINITSATGAASLTAGERAIATGKGWTITG
jgi:hypothetical protein